MFADHSVFQCSSSVCLRGSDVTAGSVASGVTVGVSPADLDQFGSLQVSQLLAGGDLH